jgi:cytochrome c oxidase subunit 2
MSERRMRPERAARSFAGAGAILATVAFARAASAATPLSYLHGFGTKTDPVVPLTWGVLIISIGVVAIVGLLLLAGVWRRSMIAPGGVLAGVAIERGGNGLRWIYIGLSLSMIALVGTLVWTVVVLAAVNSPTGKPALTIQVTGNQWWWKARYMSDDPTRIFVTANEIHIPTGKPVRIELISADVIHSFWVPALSGKTQTIPGQTNLTWIEADRPGIYRGQCTQYCGEQHAHMAFYVIADSPGAFKEWWDAQLAPAAAPTSAALAKGEHAFEYRCGACHSVRGTQAGGTVAPDLTHVMSRRTIAAGLLPNNIGNLRGWIANPAALKPGTLMPVLYLSGPELADIGSYLQTLK